MQQHRRTVSPLSAIVLTLILAVFTALAFCQTWRHQLAALDLPVRITLPGCWFNDDAFITFRYSRHLADGHGYVWNVVDPERIEGSTTLAWVVLNAIGIKLGFDPVVFSQWLGYLAGAVGLLLLYWAGRRFAGLSRGWALVAPALLAAQRQWVVWSTCGMETRAATVIALAGTLIMAREHDRRRPGWLASGLIFFVVTLFRPEAPLLHLGAGLGVLLTRRTAVSFRAVTRSGLVHGAGLLALIGCRLLYFGQPFPNTYYAKAMPLQFAEGFSYLWSFILHSHGWLWLPVLAAGVILSRRNRPLLPAMLGCQTVAWTAWIASSGGGRWEFRFLDFILPSLALLIATALAALGGAGSAARPPFLRRWAIPAVAALVIVSQASSSFARFQQRQLYSSNTLQEYATHMAWEGKILRDYLTPQDRICVGWAGAMPYFTDAWHFDPWGLNDLEIARRPYHPELPLFHRRHANWQDVVDSGVMFCDIYNKFLYGSPYPPPGSLETAAVAPWAEAGIMVYCLKFPGKGYWIFASPSSRDEVEAWASGKGLKLVYAEPLPAGVPRLFMNPSP